MEKIMDYAHQYPLVSAALVLLLLVACWRSEAVRGWVVRLVVFGLVLLALFFVFRTFRARIPSSHRPPAIEDNTLAPEDHAGKKYYRDPEERLKEAQ